MRVICQNTNCRDNGCRHSEEHSRGWACNRRDWDCPDDAKCVCIEAGIERIEHDIDIKSLELAACSKKGLWLGGEGK